MDEASLLALGKLDHGFMWGYFSRSISYSIDVRHPISTGPPERSCCYDAAFPMPLKAIHNCSIASAVIGIIAEFSGVIGVVSRRRPVPCSL